MADMQFRLLGPLEAYQNGRLLHLTPREKALLTALLLEANQVVPADQLVERLWGDCGSGGHRNTLHVLVRRLRRALEAHEPGRSEEMLARRPPGYLINVEPSQLDLHNFEELVHRARQAEAAGDLERASAYLQAGQTLWRGPALAGISAESLLRVEAPRLEEHRLAVLEERIDLDLRLERHAELIGELRVLVAEHPLRERFWEQLMLALYRAGRQADALAAYRVLRGRLVYELGVEPGRPLQELERRMLAADPMLDLAAPGSATPPPSTAATAGAADLSTTVSQTPGWPKPAQLPADVGTFTARDEQLRWLDALLDEQGEDQASAVVIGVVAGTAGVGKTALAVHWAHRVRERFGDGQLYVNLHGYAAAQPQRPIQALAHLLRGLGVEADRVPVEVEEAAGLYRSLLAGRRMLVVLDNARSAAQVRPLLPGTPGCVALITSRDRLDGLVATHSAHRLTLDVLAPTEAINLLARILGQTRATPEPEAAAELAGVCAFLPLALRIAAANLICQPGQSIASYVGRLRQGDRLAGLAIEGDPQAAVRVAFDLSYQRLAPDAQRVFRLLGIVPGPELSAPAAASLTGMAVAEAERLLDQLTAAHLIKLRAPGRFAFHDLLRLYAWERAEQED